MIHPVPPSANQTNALVKDLLLKRAYAFLGVAAVFFLFLLVVLIVEDTRGLENFVSDLGLGLVFSLIFAAVLWDVARQVR
jgi:hypothetical protein